MNSKQLLSAGLFAMLIFLFDPGWAQTRTISGKVTDANDKSPLPGVSVKVKGTDVGTSTDPEGNYRITVPAGSNTLTFTYVGYTTREVNIAGRTVINMTLGASSTALGEVVVIGYGTQRVQDVTGSVSSLSPRNFNKGVIASPEQLLQGRISGVQVTPSSGEPGAGMNITIRGAASIRSGNTPLFVVDGVPLDNEGTAGGLDAGAGRGAARNPLAFLNPNDIENITVLKDASAAAIYGSRGANGVVLITTKKGSAGGALQFTSNTSVSSTAERYDLLSPADFLRYGEQAGADPNVINFGSKTDWQDIIFRTAVSQNYNLAYGQTKPTTTYRISVGYDNQKGIVENSGLQRFTGRINAGQSFFKEKLRFDLAFTASNVQNDYAPITQSAGFEGSLIGATILANPTYPVRNEDGTYFTTGGTFRNPQNMLDMIDDSDNLNRFLGNLSGTWKIRDNLTYKATFGYDRSQGERETWMSNGLLGYTGSTNFRGINVPGVTGAGRGVVQNLKNTSTVVEQTLSFEDTFGAHNLTLLGGYSYQEFKNFPHNDIAWGQVDSLNWVKSLDGYKNRMPAVFGDSTKSELQSYFARSIYNYDDRYIITLTFRADGSSKFGANNRYGYFPAAALRWRISNENFAPKKTFDDLSLRLNWGITGNQEFPSYASQAVTQLLLNGDRLTVTNPSPDLKWETQTTYGAGIDFSVLKGRVGGSIDYFNKSTKDLLFLQEYPQPSAATRRWLNLPGKVVNRGVELGLTIGLVQKKAFNWELIYNATFLDNEVKDFGSRNVVTGDMNGPGLTGAYVQVIRSDASLGSFYLPRFTGFDAQGFNQFEGENAPSYIIGSNIPKFSSGLTNNFTFGKFNANLFINAATGFYVYNETKNAYFVKGALFRGRNVDYEAATSSENPANTAPVSTRFLEKGDFIRLANASLGYTFDVTNMKPFKTLRLTVSGQNLVLLTKYSGLDPEVSTNKARLPSGSTASTSPQEGIPSRGIDYGAYPNPRTFTFSINAGF